MQELSETRQSQKHENMVQLTTEVRNKETLWFTYCVLNHDLFSVYPWEYTVMKFAANLNLKGHQVFFDSPCTANSNKVDINNSQMANVQYA